MSVYFTTTNYLRANTSNGNSVDENLMTPLVKTNAEMWIKPILGSYFFTDLLTKYNTQALSADEISLVQDWIQPAIAWKVNSDLIVNSSLQLKNKGIQTQSGDFSNAGDFKQMAFAQRTAFDKGTYYEQNLGEHLSTASTQALFPSFTSSLNDDSIVKTCDSNLCTGNIFFI